MVSLIIDGKEVQVSEGSTILKAAEKAGIWIPTMCHTDLLRTLWCMPFVQCGSYSW